jgi:hypothetical protein
LLDFLWSWACFLDQRFLSKNGNWFPLIVIYTVSVHKVIQSSLYLSTRHIFPTDLFWKMRQTE